MPPTPAVRLEPPPAEPDGRRRVVIESVAPSVDGGRFPVKRIAGDRLTVEADCFADGHDSLAIELLWRRPGTTHWQATPMTAIGNDRWQATLALDTIGLWHYTIRGRVDAFDSWRQAFSRRVEADDLRVELATGALLAEAAARRAGAAADDDDRRLLEHWAGAQRRAAEAAGLDATALQAIGLDEAAAAAARRHPDRTLASHDETAFPLRVERPRARFGAWYEFFPRSAADDETRHGTFADCERWLPYIAAMGFDVVYLPPIHPIGRTLRKGRNNTLRARDDDVGSPWAIGAAEGGHDAILPALGDVDDFRRLLARAQTLELEIALDIAFQCSPDHPWLERHPQWFRHRPDGTIRHAENPPKKYQDIVPIDFETDDWRALWAALAGVIEHWAALGVRIFRVDNPHTKAFGFWEWAIARVHDQYPDTIFLSEAFTRPKVMHRLAKLGFSQSYTYFTWRNGRQEIADYLTELAHGPGREYLRPNLWPNTPDILPAALQYGGRPMFAARLALAATLSPSYGIYGPAFELGEHRALEEGGEEYLDSEKYQLRRWDRDRTDSLAGFVTSLNRLRREHPAFASPDGLAFLEIDNDQMIAYVRFDPGGTDVVLCVVSLDPREPQSGWLRPHPALAARVPGGARVLRDLLDGTRILWQGERLRVQVDPARAPVLLAALQAPVRREHDFDYYL